MSISTMSKLCRSVSMTKAIFFELTSSEGFGGTGPAAMTESPGCSSMGVMASPSGVVPARTVLSPTAVGRVK